MGTETVPLKRFDAGHGEQGAILLHGLGGPVTTAAVAWFYQQRDSCRC
jgi:hypothetical protein